MQIDYVVRRRFAHLERVEAKVDALYDLLTEELPGTAAEGAYVAVAGGTSFHVASCRLVQGKETARELSGDELAGSGLTPCRVCAPPALAV